MQANEIKLSIIIPTKNRYECLIPVLKALLKFIPSDDFEIIVQDNTTNNALMEEFLIETDDSRIKYFYKRESISITENTADAVANSTGKYITFIGDDDLVSPYIINITRLMEERNICCLIYKPAYYWWNTVEFANPSEFNQKCALWMINNISIETKEMDAKKELQFVLNSGAVSYFNLPRLYHGIVKRDILEKIKDITGTYLPGGCPDISFAVSLALVVDNYHYMHYPVTIFGASKNSGAGLGASNAHFKKLEEADFVSPSTIANWDNRVPLVWSAHTWYLNSTLEVLKAFYSNLTVNFFAFYGSMMAYERNLNEYYAPVIQRYCKLNKFNYLKIFVVCLKKKIGIWWRDKRTETKHTEFKMKLSPSVNDCMMILLKETNLDDNID
jgi:glycosyltransferase involved in cell wall biosynthesis